MIDLARSVIERRIYSAFTKSVPDVLDSVIERSPEQKGQAIIMAEKTKRIRPIKTVAIAAAAAVILMLGTFAAAAFTGLVGEEEAYNAARAYAIKEAQKSGGIDAFTLFDKRLEYDKSVEYDENSGIELSLSGLKAVYNVYFKIGGYSYKITVDAKSGVVINGSASTDPDWQKHLDEVGFNGPADGNWQPKDGLDCLMIAEDYLGLGRCDDKSLNASSEPNFDTQPYSCDVKILHGGYKYTVNVDGETGAINAVLAEESDDFDPETAHKHEHDPNDPYIGMFEAKVIAMNHLGITSDDGYSVYLTYDKYGRTVTGGDGEEIVVKNPYGTDVYYVYAQIPNQSVRSEVVVDAKTGEILGKDVQTDDPTALPNQEVSTEAPEGMISEAEAKAIALSDGGFDEQHVHGFAIELSDGEYSMMFEASNENGVYACRYSVNAETGEITDKKVDPI